MTSNPFEAPHASAPVSPASATGVLDPVRALSSGWAATLRNFGPWLGITVVGTVVSMVSFFTIVGWIIVIPALLYGAVTFTLNAEDGQAQFGDLFVGFSRFGDALGGMLGYIFLTFLIGLPPSIPSYINMFVGFAGGEQSLTLQYLGGVLWLPWTALVSIRFFYAPYFIVDQGMGPLDALRASWEATREQKLNNFLLCLLFIPLYIAGFIALFIGVVVSMWVMYGSLAAAYRQLTGSKPGAPSAF